MSVTRFGEISPPGQISVGLGQFLEAYLANYKTYFAKLLCYWTSFHCYKWPNIEKWSNHLVTLLTMCKCDLDPKKLECKLKKLRLRFLTASEDAENVFLFRGRHENERSISSSLDRPSLG